MKRWMDGIHCNDCKKKYYGQSLLEHAMKDTWSKLNTIRPTEKSNMAEQILNYGYSAAEILF